MSTQPQSLYTVLQSLRDKRNQLPETDRKAFMVRTLTIAIVSVLPLPGPVGNYLQYFLANEQRKVMKLLEEVNEWEIIAIDDVLESVRVYMNYRYQFAYPTPATINLLEAAILQEQEATEKGKTLLGSDADICLLSAHLEERLKNQTTETNTPVETPYATLSEEILEKRYDDNL